MIPFADLGDISHIEINSADPADYIGRWMTYYEAWDLLPGLAGVNCWQMPLL